MARIIGGVMTSHVPAIGGAIAKGRQQDPYFKPFFDGFAPVRHWLGEVRPDVVVVVYNDHGLNFFLDKMPTFAIGTASEYRSADEGWGIPVSAPFQGDEDLSWHLLEALVGSDFDMTSCQEMLVDHALTLPMALLWPDQKWPVRVVPIAINTVLFPLPSSTRCWTLGRTVGRAIQDWDSDARVLVLGTGGLSHQLEGERAGHINRAWDEQFMDSMTRDPQWATRYSINQLVKDTGTQGIELLNWVAARAALTGDVRELHRTYHIPISNTAAGIMLLENG
jgi:protocatechuate 4,5-dioxygenase, beta chain